MKPATAIFVLSAILCAISFVGGMLYQRNHPVVSGLSHSDPIYKTLKLEGPTPVSVVDNDIIDEVYRMMHPTPPVNSKWCTINNAIVFGLLHHPGWMFRKGAWSEVVNIGFLYIEMPDQTPYSRYNEPPSRPDFKTPVAHLYSILNQRIYALKYDSENFIIQSTPETTKFMPTPFPTNK